MSLQVCSCGWSKVTTYQGLRIHQGKMGCTPKGMRIPESEQFRNGFSLKSNFTHSPIKVEEPFLYGFSPSVEPDDEFSKMYFCFWGRQTEDESRQMDRGQIYGPPVKKEGEQLVRDLPTTTTRETEIRAKEKEREEEREKEERREAQKLLKIVATSDMSLQVCSCGWSKVTTYQGLRIHQGKMGCTPKGMRIPESEQFRNGFSLKSNFTHSPIKVEEPFLYGFSPSVEPDVEWGFWRSKMEEESRQMDRGQIYGPPVKKEGEQLVRDLPTTTTRETEIRAKEKEREEEREKEERREAQKLLKLRQNRIRADLKQEIQRREQKMADVTSSAKALKASLDTEWLEINKVFIEVMKVVKDTLSEALQPLEKRRHRVVREEQDLNQKLQKEIDELKKTIDELDKKADLQASYQTSLDDSQVWKNVNIACSFSLGSLRSKTSDMMEQIHQEMEKLSSVELKRITSFAVDVKLDPATAHRCLVLSPDGKTVKYGGQDQKVPDAPERFDVHASIMGVNMLTSGKSYWEVEVGNKTGWDLGVASRDAKRKGKLSVTPDEGYWVIVHYQEEKYAALTAPPVSLTLTVKPQKVGVFVDYEEGLVSFYNATARSHIYSFTECSFSDEILPYFSPHLKHNRKNSDPLIISPV